MSNRVPGVLLFMAEEDLYRLGNSASPKLDEFRPQDVDTNERNGILTVVANGKGISLITEACLPQAKPGSWL